jgi:hypothetical protein
VGLLSETHLKPCERIFIPNYHLYWTDHVPGRKVRTAIVIRNDIPHNHVDLPSLVSTEATEICVPTGNMCSEVLFAAVCKSPGHAWNDAGITELLSFRRKSLLAGDLNAKHPFWSSVVSNPSGTRLLNLLHIYEFEISAPQCPTHYSPAGNSDVLEPVVHKRLSQSLVREDVI